MKPVPAAQVHAALAKHYPPHVLNWVKRATWHAHPGVPLAKIDMARRPGARNPEKVAAIADAVKAGKPMPPVMLVNTGEAKLQIADGYHRTLGFEHAGKSKIPALIASGVGTHGPWEKRMHAAKLNLTAEHTHVLDLAGTCTGPGPCDTTPLGTGKNWLQKVGGLPAYIRAIAHSLRRGGMDESRAISTAIATVKRWAAGGGDVTPETRARAAKAVAEWEAKKAASHSLTAEAAATVDLTFTEQLHPRGKKGTSSGGKFVAKGGNGGGTESSPAADTRDFQRRTGLKQTGKYDAATQRKIARLTTPKTGGGSGKGRHGKRKGAKRSGGSTAAQATAQRRANAARTAVAVNKLTPAQRELFRAKHPAPPSGYRWNAAGMLVAVATNLQARRVRAILARP